MSWKLGGGLRARRFVAVAERVKVTSLQLQPPLETRSDADVDVTTRLVQKPSRKQLDFIVRNPDATKR